MADSGAPVFSGSYPQDDVTFLLKPLDLQPMSDLEEKERMIQSGQRHYSEMISVERQPTSAYLSLFEQALEANIDRMAQDLVSLAEAILCGTGPAIVLVSLARAGTPVGIALRRWLQARHGLEVPHYSISIIRDRGIDAVALDHIRARHPDRVIVFIDGWTGKGAIASELNRCIPAYNTSRRAEVAPGLFVLADLAGVSAGCGSIDDYLIPSSILNATISGLVSRSILNDQIGPGDFHGCLFFDHLRAQDRSVAFVDLLVDRARRVTPRGRPGPDALATAAARTERLIRMLRRAYDNPPWHHIKPGIGEATRALLRRVPRALCVRDSSHPDVRHLIALAEERDVRIDVQPGLPLQATAIIRSLGDA